MSELLEIIKNFNIENIWMLIALCVVVISTAASHIQLLYTSQFEAVLMNKNEESKRFFFIYIILFLVLGVVNYYFTADSAMLLMNMILLILTWLASLIFWIIHKMGKLPKVYWCFKERKDLIIWMTSAPMCIFVASSLMEISHLSLIVIGSLIEVLGIAITVLNTSNTKTRISVMIANEKWYVFKRIDEKYLLCGDNCRIEHSSRTKLLVIDEIVKGNVCFEKEE